MSRKSAVTPESNVREINWSALAPAFAFVLIVGLGIAFYLAQEAQVRRVALQERDEVRRLGLPDGFPLSDIPAYPGMKVGETKREEATSTDGKPMDLWEIKATTADDKQKVFDFYKAKLLARGMGQTQYISIPTGLGVTYGDASYSVELEIEKQPKDEATKLVMRVYRLR